MLRCYSLAAPLFDPPIERVEFPYRVRSWPDCCASRGVEQVSLGRNRALTPFVPAKAGTQGQKPRACARPWIPAYAGMNGWSPSIETEFGGLDGEGAACVSQFVSAATVRRPCRRLIEKPEPKMHVFQRLLEA